MGKMTKEERTELDRYLNYDATGDKEEYCYPDLTDDKGVFTNLGLAVETCSAMHYNFDAETAIDKVTKKDVNDQLVSDFMKYTAHEIADIRGAVNRLSWGQAELDLDGSWDDDKNEKSLESRVKKIINKNYHVTDDGYIQSNDKGATPFDIKKKTSSKGKNKK